MKPQEFIYWLNGFVDAVGEKGPTPKQWETIVSELDKVGEPVLYPTYTPDLAPIQTLPFIQPADPYNPYKVYCGTGGESGVVTTKNIITDGFIQNSSITRANPPSTLTTTSTAYGHVSGSTVSYTANLPKELLND